MWGVIFGLPATSNCRRPRYRPSYRTSLNESEKVCKQKDTEYANIMWLTIIVGVAKRSASFFNKVEPLTGLLRNRPFLQVASRHFMSPENIIGTSY